MRSQWSSVTWLRVRIRVRVRVHSHSQEGTATASMATVGGAIVSAGWLAMHERCGSGAGACAGAA